ncbi:hypothetical protein J8I26_02875 [Herbaspirillum sp. LeCh32-8]|uniref:hypothetical protein n=1 Tax=Herbaspirillum sp. LeCh32-8 TaxID=2821356 RepID=UPI001AE79841|nr:hypothetical protein [Herbaspirillum sp. LeCh32-8]MBP0597029.1 hypothetical protein [Herbaspirillum sp. LeCh32-8]
MLKPQKPTEPDKQTEPSMHQPIHHRPPLPQGQGSHNDGKEYGTAKRPAGGAHADPSGKARPG